MLLMFSHKKDNRINIIDKLKKVYKVLEALIGKLSIKNVFQLF